VARGARAALPAPKTGIQGSHGFSLVGGVGACSRRSQARFDVCGLTIRRNQVSCSVAVRFDRIHRPCEPICTPPPSTNSCPRPWPPSSVSCKGPRLPDHRRIRAPHPSPRRQGGTLCPRTARPVVASALGADPMATTGQIAWPHHQADLTSDPGQFSLALTTIPRGIPTRRLRCRYIRPRVSPSLRSRA